MNNAVQDNIKSMFLKNLALFKPKTENVVQTKVALNLKTLVMDKKLKTFQDQVKIQQEALAKAQAVIEETQREKLQIEQKQKKWEEVIAK